MTATIIQFVPRPNPNRETLLEQEAVRIMNVALIGPGGIDDLVYETSLGFVDTAPSEMPPGDSGDCA